MAGLLQPFRRGVGGSASDAAGFPVVPTQQPRRETRLTPPLSLLRAEVEPNDGHLFIGQLWDISLSGASVSMGRVVFPHPPNTEVILRLRSRHSTDVLPLKAIVRWVDINHGVTFVGLALADKIIPGSFLDAFLDFSQDRSMNYEPKSA